MADLARFYETLLVIRCQVGDRAAFEELVGLFQPKLCAFLYKMWNASNAVEDLAQDVWMDVYRDLDALKNPAAFRPWFYQIARNRIYRAMRRQPAIHEPMEADLPDTADESEDFGAEDAANVKKAIDELSPEHREVLLLRFMEDMSYDDIARVLECPIGTVRSRIHNAKRALRQIVEK